MDRDNLKQILDELRFLNLSEHGMISREAVENNNIDYSVVLKSYKKEYIEFVDIGKIPRCDYRVTLEGLTYLSDINKILNNYNLSDIRKKRR